MKKYLKVIWVLMFILLTMLAIALLSGYTDRVNKSIANDVIRLHVIANSNSQADQALKYKVRDSVLKYMESHESQVFKKDGKMMVGNKTLGEIENVAAKTANGVSTRVEFGNFAFPTKTYGDVSFPAGYYNAVRVKLGSAAGRNWWCVMFPPVCLVDNVTGKMDGHSKALLKKNMPSEEYKIVTGDSDSAVPLEKQEIKVKFKAVEIMQSIKIKWEEMFGGKKG